MTYDVIIVGGGQTGLALGYYLRRTKLNYLILDAEDVSGGSWQHHWESLSLFSPAQWSSLPGVLMPGGTMNYPGKTEVIDYLRKYEDRYEFPIRRPVLVQSVTHEQGEFSLQTDQGLFQSSVLIGATGSFRNPWIPEVKGRSNFRGHLLHSSAYKTSAVFDGQRVAVVGEGNSGAQILAELSKVATTYWITKETPDFLPDHVDGRYLFDAASQLYEAKKKGKEFIPPNLGHIVMVPAVKEARERGVYQHYAPIRRFHESGLILEDDQKLELDTVIFCTGFRPDLQFLEQLPVTIRHSKIPTHGTRSKELPGLWMVGYGSWTGFASATIIGLGRSARITVREVEDFLRG